VQVEFERWWRAIEEARFEELDGEFVHPVQDRAVMAGNGTIGLEIVDDLPGVDAVLVPYGGGGLATGIASAVKHRSPDTEVLAVEPETAAASSCALAAGGPAAVPFERSFVDGAGASTILPIMWPLASAVLDGAITLAVAAATAARGEEWESLVAVVSGGNIDATVLATILGGDTP
jgi:threonine dehydratase